MNDWFYIEQSTTNTIVPISQQELLTKIGAQTLVWKEGAISEWVEANKHPELAVLFDSIANEVVDNELPFTEGSFHVVLKEACSDNLYAVKVFQEVLGVSIVEAAQMVDRLPSIIKSDLSHRDAHHLQGDLAQRNIVVEIEELVVNSKITENTEIVVQNLSIQNQERKVENYDETSIVVHTSYNPLGVAYSMCTPIIEINGQVIKSNWGYNFFKRPQGNYNVKVYFRYLLKSKCGLNEVNINLEKGERIKINFHMPPFDSAKGKMTVEKN